MSRINFPGDDSPKPTARESFLDLKERMRGKMLITNSPEVVIPHPPKAGGPSMLEAQVDVNRVAIADADARDIYEVAVLRGEIERLKRSLFAVCLSVAIGVALVVVLS